ncbi:hypothetical protein P280DRAFT_504451 [Massarina eburnea CBS 473.64]|uniref:DUF3112 domain-containing protein n=1 Tax=Massarina eburnea CBS 473.64 TaxID=1395130 RepID=A0A6A6SCT8_9PLEO|nr:hypothetical protein P280DRAFT_504451 [Massarina eburnea CBS 473.64]
MSSAAGAEGQAAQHQQKSPPYAPTTESLGGLPSKIPDIPPTAVFLFVYIIFAITHQKILLANKKRGHKFVFNGALFGFCAIRIVTMSLRIAWACYPRNIALGIVAQVFVYMGTIILYICNWFFTQRVIRAQHPRFGWSKPYRIVHRAAIVCLILSLLMLIVGAIQQFFTLDAHTLRVDHALTLTGQTYFAVFCFAPIILITVSLIVPRRGIDKFGHGRLRNNITILLVAAVILSIGQIFRVVIAYLPTTPLRNAQGQANETRWYYSKACFYIFNFTTEIIVAIAYAVVRVDLRFHIPNGSSKPGDYQAKRDSKYKVDVFGNENKLKRRSNGSVLSTRSTETVQEYEGSLFDDSQTLADSLRYPSTVLEVDSKTGNWKIKRASQPASMYAVSHHNDSQTSIYDASKAPPLPHSDWPLRESQMPRGQIPVMEHRNRASASPSGAIRNKVNMVPTPDTEQGDALDNAIRQLEANSTIATLPPTYDFSASRKSRSFHSKEGYTYNPDDPLASDIPKKHVYESSTRNSTSSRTKKYDYAPSNAPSTSSSHPIKRDYSADSVIAASPNSDLRKKNEYLRIESSPESRSPQNEAESEVANGRNNAVSTGHTSMELESAAAEREFARFSFEASPRTGSFNGSEKDWEKGSR